MAAAFLNRVYKKGFILTEEALLKIDELIRKRLSGPEATAEMHFSALREDGMLLEYSLPSELIAEENSPRNPITRITLIGVSLAGSAELVFDAKSSVELTIRSDVRDTAYLLYSDLKEYLGAEVLRFPLAAISPGISRLLLPLVVLIFPVALIMGIHKSDPKKVSVALQSMNVQDKLNWLISDSAGRSDTVDIKLMIALSLSALAAILLIGPLAIWLYPYNIFHWGKSAIVYDRRKDLRAKFFWGVLVALVIGMLSTAAYEKLKL